MTRKTTKTRKKAAPIVVTVLVVLYLAPLAALAFALLPSAGQESPLPVLFLLGYLLLGGAVLVGVLKALRERLREIDGGEEEDASQY
ncbi:MAG: hypothetical protein HFG00_10750 [Oscillibacter sp.]|nr:hypothetical protein [Oscillibacter sp.]